MAAVFAAMAATLELAAGVVATRPTLTLAGIGAGALVVAPELTVLAAAVGIEEEVAPGDNPLAPVSASARFGSNLYHAQVGGLRLIVLIAVAAALISLLRRKQRIWRLAGVLIGLLIVWSFALAMTQGSGVKGALTATVPWTVLGAGLLLGSAIRGSSSLQQATTLCLAVLLGLKALVACYVYVRGGAMPIGDVEVVYYDSSLSLFAGSAAIAALLCRKRGFVGYSFLLSGGVLIALSMRRNVVLSLLFVVLLLIAMHSSRTAVIRTVGGLAAAILVLWVAVPHVTTAAERSLAAGMTALTSGSGDSSTVGHVQDLHSGYSLVRSSPVLGVGAYSAARDSFVVASSSNLYIHDEYLQTWARFGLPAALLLVILLGAAAVRAIRLLRRPATTLLTLTAGVFVVATPVALIFFPHVSTLTRFDLLIGVAIGLLSTNSSPKTEGPTP